MMPKQYMKTKTVTGTGKTTQDLLKQNLKKTLGASADIKCLLWAWKKSLLKGDLGYFYKVLATMIYIALRFDLKFAMFCSCACT